GKGSLLLPHKPLRAWSSSRDDRRGWTAAPRRFALLPYNTHLSLRRRVTDCGNPREGRDQMDRHVASLLAMTGGGKSSWPPSPNGLALVRALAMTGGGRSSLPSSPNGLALVRALAMTNVCSLKGAKPLRQCRGAELVDARRADG